MNNTTANSSRIYATHNVMDMLAVQESMNYVSKNIFLDSH